jgi:alpha-mannosidase
MKTKCGVVLVTLALTVVSLATADTGPGRFSRLTALPTPKIVAAAEEFPGGNYNASNLLDGRPSTEYAVNGLGTKTFVEFDFDTTVRVAAFLHQDRNDPATVAASELIFNNAEGKPLATVQVPHVNRRGGVTFFVLPQPVAAQHVRWHVTKLGSPYGTVGGAEIKFFSAGEPEAAPRGIGIAARTVQVIERQNGSLVQPLKVMLDYPYAEPTNALVRVEGQSPQSVKLEFGSQTLDYTVAAAEAARTLNVSVEAGGREVAARAVALKPARKLTVYILPHSHTDIGYTAIQTDIEEKQINNLLQGMADARHTADYPEGARFVWNVEVLWAADLFLQRLSEQQSAEFCAAVKNGQVALNGMYLNELTGLCRPEELLRLFRFATQLGEHTGVPVDSAMISDVPGYTWGTVTAMAQAGIRYFSVGVNAWSRNGDVMTQWENKPFWWVGPDGNSKVLVWIPFLGYAMSHVYGKMSPQWVEDLCANLDKRDYPYDIACVRWSGHGDNAMPDPAICDFVKDWNAAHAWPHFVISSTSAAFRALEKRYGDKLPLVRGDWTPYWEDGAASSAAETAMNRASSERLAQAETLWAMLAPSRYPAKRFEEAWNHVLLYSEHTWGAFCSVSEPANPFTSDQWTIKQSYATAANLQSRQLLSAAVQNGLGFQSVKSAATTAPVEELFHFDIFNTTSWPRTEVVLLPSELAMGRNSVSDAQGRPVPSQWLASRELAVLVRDLPPFSGRRYALAKAGPAAAIEAKATAAGATLDNGRVRVRVDEQTGGIADLRADRIEANLAGAADGYSLNDYLYLIGDNPARVQRNGPVKITVRDNGPLVASLLVESAAPGCHKLAREIRLVAGGDYVELFDTVDKKRLEAANYCAKEGTESVHFAFPFHVPGGEMRFDVPLAVMRPEYDQMPNACKNWLTAGRWVDVSNKEFGVTWVTLDAPLVEVGGITATILENAPNPNVWRKKIEPTQTLYSWAMNNHENTNYRAYQEGPTLFRFVLRPHRGTTAASASRFATAFSQPLVTVPARGVAPPATALLRVEPAAVLVMGFKPSDDGKAWIVRLFGAGEQAVAAKLTWSAPAPRHVWISDTSEKPIRKITGDIAVPALGVVTLRVELPK